jgi:hypothetical protein
MGCGGQEEQRSSNCIRAAAVPRMSRGLRRETDLVKYVLKLGARRSHLVSQEQHCSLPVRRAWSGEGRQVPPLRRRVANPGAVLTPCTPCTRSEAPVRRL